MSAEATGRCLVSVESMEDEEADDDDDDDRKAVLE